MAKEGVKIQSATEYLLTYGWAFLIAAVVIAALYLFIFAPTALAPSSCTFSAGAYCQDLILGSSLTLSKMAVLLTNTNPYSIINPKITVNVSGSTYPGTCTPNFILPGGAIICNATIIPAVSQSALASGRFIFSYIPCPGGNVTLCSSNSGQGYTGTFTTHASPLLSPTTLNITLSIQNASQVALSTSLDKLTANVRLLGTPLSGATVNFTSNSINAVINPSITTTDSSGNAVSYISSNRSGSVFVTASYANAIANVIVTFTPPACYTISIPSVSGAVSNVLLIDGVGYSSFPQQLCFGQGTSHTYSFQTPVGGGTGTQFVFNSASGCGASSQTGTLSVSSNCTLVGNYLTQYYLTTAASPASGGSVTPVSGWHNSGSSTTLGETSNAGYAFNGFIGTGSGSYSGANTMPLVTFGGPISETGSFTSTSTTTTTTTSTTTTVPPNPTCGLYTGDAIYSGGSISLTCNVVASNAIIIQSGVTLDVCSHYIQANAYFINKGTITDTCSGGAGGYGPNGNANAGAPGGVGGNGISRTSVYLGKLLTSGAGGGGGATGGHGLCGSSAGSGGSGGKGGGIVEIYSGNCINQGTITVAGSAGAKGEDGGCNGCYTSVSGGGGGGGGGVGGTVFLGCTNLITLGTIITSGGAGGPSSAGAASYGYYGGGVSCGGGGAGGPSGGYGGNGGACGSNYGDCGTATPPGSGGGGGSGSGKGVITGNWVQ